LALAEVFGFDQAFFDQGLQAEVDLAQTDAQFLSQLALADVWIVLQFFEDLVAVLGDGAMAPSPKAPRMG